MKTKAQSKTKMPRTLFVEIRAAEGGEDAKALVDVQAKVYAKYCELERL